MGSAESSQGVVNTMRPDLIELASKVAENRVGKFYENQFAVAAYLIHYKIFSVNFLLLRKLHFLSLNETRNDDTMTIQRQQRI